jgi:hypothetical protein
MISGFGVVFIPSPTLPLMDFLPIIVDYSQATPPLAICNCICIESSGDGQLRISHFKGYKVIVLNDS